MAVWVEKAVAQEARKAAQPKQAAKAAQPKQAAKAAQPKQAAQRSDRGSKREKMPRYQPRQEQSKQSQADAEALQLKTHVSKKQEEVKPQPAATSDSEAPAPSEDLPHSAASSSPVEAKCADIGCAGDDAEAQLSHSGAETQPQECYALSAFTSEALANSLSCPSGHTLEEFTTTLPAFCGICNDEPEVGVAMWGCRICDFDLCSHCQQQVMGGLLLGCTHDGNSTDSTDTPRNAGDVSWANLDNVWWPQEVDWSWDWNEQETDYEYELQSDETLLGPDGEMYDIFYPGDSPPEELSLSSRCCSADTSDVGDGEASCSHDGEQGLQVVAAENQSCDKHAGRPQTSAEIGILSILTFMRSVAADRYPARALLFETVKTAAAIALGDHFDRFALVGSTALRIDTPDSDLDAVVFTRSSIGSSGEEVSPPMSVSILKQISDALYTLDPSLRLQLVDCTRVPVLTAFSADGLLSLDLTVDQPLSEWHVLWLQSQRTEPVLDPPFVQDVPVPTLDGWEQGLEAAALRCIKWWLRRRHIPVSKEGGYPSIVWALMVIHALRCSVFYNEAGDSDSKMVNERTLLGALAAFFDRFSEGGLAGTLLFAEGKHAQFWPQPSPPNCTTQSSALSSESFSVLDPTTTSENSASFGIVPLELAPRISSATQLLQAYELHRAQQLSALALMDEECSLDFGEGGMALSALFAEVDERSNVLPAVVPHDSAGVIFLHNGKLMFGLLKHIHSKPGWGATFLHRHDKQSRIGVRLCYVDTERQIATLQADSANDLHWLSPSDVVCMAFLWRHNEAHSYARRRPVCYEVDAESIERWCKMHTLLCIEFTPQPTDMGPRKSRQSRKKQNGKVVRI